MLQNLELLSLDFAQLDFVLAELDRDRSRAVLPRLYQLESELDACWLWPLLAVLRSDPTAVPTGAGWETSFAMPQFIRS